MNFLKVLILIIFLHAPHYVQAQEAGAGDAVPGATDESNLERRLELAAQMQALRPARQQVDGAIDAYVSGLPPEQQETYRMALRDALNYKALEKVSIDAYAQVYTVEELEAMVEYFSKPEARSASEKGESYAAIVYPEIVRMLDKAMMKAKTGGAGP